MHCFTSRAFNSFVDLSSPLNVFQATSITIISSACLTSLKCLVIMILEANLVSAILNKLNSENY
ncbi:hypothetical protein Sjap_025561 [Stephania japonica]|uniref:Uncharacterized protein n=1 Tax=Stephania japonica TaxID=461633 RepID=A0AAP0E1U3_9MAGN